MKRTAFALFFSLLSCFPISSEAQKVYRISALVAADHLVPAFEGFKKKMVELGYQEGKNVKYDFYYARGDADILNKQAQQLVRDKPDIIVTAATSATVPVAKATAGTNIPVVFLTSANPLELVKGYSSSGNNLTGISTAALDLTAKRLELLKELTPWVKQVAYINNPQGVNYQDNLVTVREAAKKLGFTIVEINATNREELAQVTATITRKVADAILTAPDITIIKSVEIVIQQSLKVKLPLIPDLISSVEKGGLAGYGPDYFALGQQGAVLVDKILKGARPTDLPIEQPYKLKLVINLKTAKAIGLNIPKQILIRADEVIE